MLTRISVCAFMALARLGELEWSRRNLGASGASREGPASRRTYPLIVALHSAVIGLTLFRGGRPRRASLLLLLALQPARLWVLLTLGKRWNARGAVPEGLQPVTAGPYRFVRHPNYSVVLLELLSLPLAFGLPRLALAALAANGLLLAVRIHDEERLLFATPGYAEHFGRKQRLIPGVF
jgi:methyltransferase